MSQSEMKLWTFVCPGSCPPASPSPAWVCSQGPGIPVPAEHHGNRTQKPQEDQPREALSPGHPRRQQQRGRAGRQAGRARAQGTAVRFLHGCCCTLDFNLTLSALLLRRGRPGAIAGRPLWTPRVTGQEGGSHTQRPGEGPGSQISPGARDSEPSHTATRSLWARHHLPPSILPKCLPDCQLKTVYCACSLN